MMRCTISKPARKGGMMSETIGSNTSFSHASRRHKGRCLATCVAPAPDIDTDKAVIGLAGMF